MTQTLPVATSPSSTGPPAEATITAGSATITAVQVPGSTGLVVIDGSTLSLGGAALTVSGQTLSLGASGIIAAGAGVTTTIPFSAAPVESEVPGEAIITAGSRTLTAIEVPGTTGLVAINGHTISIGGSPMVMAGQTLSLAPSGIIAAGAGGTSTIPFSGAPVGSELPGEAVITAGSRTLTAVEVPGATGLVMINGHTISIGGSPMVMAGQTFSLASSGIVAANVGSTTIIPIGSATPLFTGLHGKAVITAASTTFTAMQVPGASGVVEIDGSTISLGGAALTVGGYTLSLTGGGFVVSSSGQSAETVAFSTATDSVQEVASFTAGGETHTVVENGDDPGQVVLDGSKTLSVGGSAVTISGATITLGPGGVLLDGTSTLAWHTTTAAASGRSGSRPESESPASTGSGATITGNSSPTSAAASASSTSGAGRLGHNLIPVLIAVMFSMSLLLSLS